MLVDYSDSEPEEQQLEGLDASDSAASGSNSHDLIHRELNVPELEVTRGSVRLLALPALPSPRRQHQGQPSPARTPAPPPPLPPLPASFRSLYATNVRGAVTDDPSLHGGRARQVGHVEGNWPTHIFLEWVPAVEEQRRLERVLVKACRGCNESDHRASSASSGRSSSSKGISCNSAVQSLLRSDLNVPLPLHISLSAPLTLRTEQKDAVAAAVEASVTRSGARPFVVSPTRLCWVSNSEGSRSFLVLKLSRPENEDLNRLLSACNASVARFGLKPLYSTYSSSSPPSSTSSSQHHALSNSAPMLDAVGGDISDAFHVSIAWTLGGVGNIWSSAGLGHVRDANDDDDDADDDDNDDDITSLRIRFDTVKLKIGNIVKDMRL